MAFEYDLVVIGATVAGLEAARLAIAAKKRVALVQHSSHPLQDQQEYKLLKLLEHLAQHSSLKFSDLSSWIEAAIAPWDFYEPLALLAAAGVDVIPEMGRFVWQPHIAFVTDSRRLVGAKYVLTTGSVWEKPPHTHFLTLTDLLNVNVWQRLATTIVIVGLELPLLNLAGALQRLGKHVTLLSEAPQLFSHEDPEWGHIIQTQLESLGIRICLGVPPEQQELYCRGESTSVIWGDRRYGHTTNLNLLPDMCRPPQQWLQVNARLQTIHPQIYGCGAVLGGYDLPELAIAEANTVVKTMLGKPQQCPYATIPYRLLRTIPFDRVGLQPPHIAQPYSVLTKTIAMDSIDQLLFPVDLSVKLWLDARQKIVGASVVGDCSGRLIYYYRDLIRSGQTFTSWRDHLQNVGMLADISGGVKHDDP